VLFSEPLFKPFFEHSEADFDALFVVSIWRLKAEVDLFLCMADPRIEILDERVELKGLN
jgi:hypothetical protein